MKIITIVARKGGVGKTTFAYLESTYLVQKLNKRVLLIDGDPQASLGDCFFDVDQENLLGDLFSGNKNINDLIKNTSIKNLDIITSNILLDDFNQILVYKPAREKILFNQLKSHYSFLQNNYDYILIDTNPSLSLINQNLMAIANDIIIISDRSKFSLKGIMTLGNAWKSICESLELPFNMNTILLNKIGNQVTSRDFIEIVNNAFPKQVLKNYIKEYAIIEKAVISKKTIMNLKRLEKLGNPIQKINEELIKKGVI